MDLHNKAYNLNHWMLSLYAFKYLQCSVTLLSQGWKYYCRSPDFKSPTGPTKNLERLYNQVVVWLFGCLVGWLFGRNAGYNCLIPF